MGRTYGSLSLDIPDRCYNFEQPIFKRLVFAFKPSPSTLLIAPNRFPSANERNDRRRISLGSHNQVLDFHFTTIRGMVFVSAM
ncbi:hypothetical protein ONZ45_g13861 [Pleurotus djamor]|nr:hypothetical protein ONZ45_g13861 [Pleurotus djamor]